MPILLEASTGIISGIGGEVLIGCLTGLVSLIGGYVVIRERILKTEMKITSMTEYIDRKNELIDNKILDVQGDVQEFKELNKETTNSLIENTAAIRELRVVLTMLKEQLGMKAIRKVKNSSDDD